MQQSQLAQFSYELQQSLSYALSLCLVITMNHNNTQLIAGDYSSIKLFQFKDGVLKLFKILYTSSDIITLNYFKKKQNFMSGQYENQITIWPYNNIKSSKYLVKLSGCSNSINCLLIHPSEDLIICGTSSIEFWSSSLNINEHQQWVQCQCIGNEISTCYGLSLNSNGSELIACGNTNLILVMKGSNTQQWIITQKVSVENQGARLTYISDQIFAFQPYQSNYLQIYTLIVITGEYIKSQDIQVQGGNQSCYEYFPSIYIPSKQIILSKNGKFINIISICTQLEQDDMKFNLQQSIQFGTQSVFGTMSNNGEYLITWDYDIGQIQIRKYKQRFIV